MTTSKGNIAPVELKEKVEKIETQKEEKKGKVKRALNIAKQAETTI